MTGLDEEIGEGATNGDVGRAALGGEGKVIDTGKGKFGMDVKFVSPT
jgi:WD repeat-containing protein 61